MLLRRNYYSPGDSRHQPSLQGEHLQQGREADAASGQVGGNDNDDDDDDDDDGNCQVLYGGRGERVSGHGQVTLGVNILRDYYYFIMIQGSQRICREVLHRGGKLGSSWQQYTDFLHQVKLNNYLKKKRVIKFTTCNFILSDLLWIFLGHLGVIVGFP